MTKINNGFSPDSERSKCSQHYPKPVRDALIVVGKLRAETKKHRVRLSLEGIRNILKDAADSIEAIADGRESLEIFDQLSNSAEKSKTKIDRALARGEKVLDIDMNHVDSDNPTGNQKTAHKRWQTVRLGENVELRIRGDYSQKTLDQLTLLGQFVDSILIEDEINA